MKKHLHFMTGCKLGASLRKSGLQLLVAALLDMQRTKLESSNLKKALEWKNAFKDLLFTKFGSNSSLIRFELLLRLVLLKMMSSQ